MCLCEPYIQTNSRDRLSPTGVCAQALDTQRPVGQNREQHHGVSRPRSRACCGRSAPSPHCPPRPRRDGPRVGLELSRYIQNVQRRPAASLLHRLSVDAEPVEARVLRVAPVGRDPELHDLESALRPSLEQKGRGRDSRLLGADLPGPAASPTGISERKGPGRRGPWPVRSQSAARTHSSGDTRTASPA